MAKKDVLVLEGPEYAEMHLDPAEAYYVDISLEDVCRLLERGEQLWGEDIGAAVLHWCSKEPYEDRFVFVPNSDRPSLVILFNRPYGFHFRWDQQGVEEMGFDPDQQESVRVLHELCGEPAFFPSRSFVSLATAKQVVKAFVKSGVPYRGLRWVAATGYCFNEPDAWRALADLAAETAPGE